MPDERYMSFGYNKWKQKPMRIGTPAGTIRISRTNGHSVCVSISVDGERMADHVGKLVAHVHEQDATIYLEHEEREREA